MPLIVVILVDLAVLYFFFGNSLLKNCRSARGRRRFQLKEYEKGLRDLLLRDEDILLPQHREGLEAAIAEIHEARCGGDEERETRCLAKCERGSMKNLPPAKSGAWIRGRLEVLIVALGVAFGIRALFVQPFKIPTGSMQPTLYGIHFRCTEEPPSMNPLCRFFSYWNFSRSAVDVIAEEPGQLDWESFQPSPKNKPFLPESIFRVGNCWYRFPGTPDQARSMILDYQTRKAQRGPLELPKGYVMMYYQNREGRPCTMYVRQAGTLDWGTLKTVRGEDGQPLTHLTIGDETYTFELAGEDVKKQIIHFYLHSQLYLQQQGLTFAKGDVIVRGYAESGDHLFVNRLGLLFAEPQRGQPMVFMTAGLTSKDGRPFGGGYYIKRLVGLPGDTLQIRDRKLYVKPRGENEFRVMDETVHPGFGRLYSMRGDYHGYAHMVPNPRLGFKGGAAVYLKNNDDTVVVPEGEYFMMGDNSENSWDSRWFGSVPRANLVGTPGFVWWPLSRRWGLPDRCEPDPELGDTPPTVPVLE